MVDNLKDKLKQFVIESGKRKKRHWYQAPTVRQHWGEEQEDLETDWADVFFDLIFVAMAFKLGKQISENIEEGEGLKALLFFFGQYFPMYDAWYRRANYIARFTHESLLHEMLDTIENVIVAFMALYLGTEKQIISFPGSGEEGNNTDISDSAYFSGINLLCGFSICKSLFTCIYVLRYLEIKYISTKLNASFKKQQKLKNNSNFSIYQQTISLAITSVTAITAYYGYITLSLYLLIFSYIVPSFLLNFVVRRPPSVPLNGPFMIKRFGEFSMLMLGEGVLQIIILNINSEIVERHMILFGLSYLILSMLEVIQFYSLPYKNSGSFILHTRKEKWSLRVALILFTKPIFYASYIWIGISLTKFIEYNEYVVEDTFKTDNFKWLVVGSLSAALMLIVIQKMMHIGLISLLYGTNAKSVHRAIWKLQRGRLAFFVLFLISPLLFLILPEIELRPSVFLTICFLFSFLFFGLSFLEKVFTGYTDEEIEEKAQREFSEEEEYKYKLPVSKSADGFEIQHTISSAQEFGEKMDMKKEKLGHMLGYLRSHAEYLRTGIDKTSIQEYDRVKMYHLMDEIGQLRQLTELIENNLNTLFPEIRSLNTYDTSVGDDGIEDEDEQIIRRDRQQPPPVTPESSQSTDLPDNENDKNN